MVLALSACPLKLKWFTLKVSAAWLAVESPGWIEQSVLGNGGIWMPDHPAAAAIAWKADVSSAPLQALPATTPLQTAPLERTSYQYCPVRIMSDVVVTAATLPVTETPFPPLTLRLAPLDSVMVCEPVGLSDTPPRLASPPAPGGPPVPPGVTGTVLMPPTDVPLAV